MATVTVCLKVFVKTSARISIPHEQTPEDRYPGSTPYPLCETSDFHLEITGPQTVIAHG